MLGTRRLTRRVRQPLRLFLHSLLILLYFFLLGLVVWNIIHSFSSSSSNSSKSSGVEVEVKSLPQQPQREQQGVMSRERSKLYPPMKTRNILFQQEVDSLLKKDYERGRRLLSNMDAIRRANSHILPSNSYFKSRKNKRKHAKKGGVGLCLGADEKRCVGKFGRGLSSFYVAAPKYKILGCLIRKNMNTLLHGILYYLSNEEKIRASGISLSSLTFSMNQATQHRLSNGSFAELAKDELYESKGTLHSSSTTLYNPFTKQKPEWVLDESWRLLAVTREPVDRFLSGFLDKCIRRCDFEIFLHRYAQVKHSPAAGGSNSGLTTGKSDLPVRLTNVFAEAGVGTESLSYIRHHLEKDTTHHVTHDTEARRFLEQRLRGSPFLMEFLVRMFYWDFRLLGFPLPRLSWGSEEASRQQYRAT